MTVAMVKIGENLSLVDSEAQRFREYKASVSEGELVEADFRSPSKKATAQQARLFHPLAHRYAATLGYNQVEAKHELCILFGVSVSMGQALEAPPSWSGYAVEYHGVKYLRKSTTQYTVAEYKDLIDGTVHACIEADVDIEDIMREVE